MHEIPQEKTVLFHVPKKSPEHTRIRGAESLEQVGQREFLKNFSLVTFWNIHEKRRLSRKFWNTLNNRLFYYIFTITIILYL